MIFTGTPQEEQLRTHRAIQYKWSYCGTDNETVEVIFLTLSSIYCATYVFSCLCYADIWPHYGNNDTNLLSNFNFFCEAQSELLQIVSLQYFCNFFFLCFLNMYFGMSPHDKPYTCFWSKCRFHINMSIYRKKLVQVSSCSSTRSLRDGP